MELRLSDMADKGEKLQLPPLSKSFVKAPSTPRQKRVKTGGVPRF
jgi:hypothetical protein